MGAPAAADETSLAAAGTTHHIWHTMVRAFALSASWLFPPAAFFAFSIFLARAVADF